MKLVVRISATVPIVVVVIAVIMELDPLYLILRGDPGFNVVNLGCILFRVTFSCVMVPEFAKSGVAFFLIGLMVVCSSSNFIKRITPRSKTYNKLNSRIIQYYRELQIWNGYANENFCYFAKPLIILFGASFIILTSYGSIRMVDKLPWFLYPAVPFSNSLAVLFLVAMVPNAAKVFEDSNSYLANLKKNLRDKNDTRVARSLKPLGIQIGPFGQAKRNLLLGMLKYCTETTGNLLITF